MTINQVSAKKVINVQVLNSAVQVTEKLNEQEVNDLHQLELKIEQFFYEAGKALSEIRNRRLYRSTHKKFEDYCRDRFQFSRDKADMMIKSVKIVDNLKTDDNCRRFLPTAESQVRDLVNLTLVEQCQIYKAAIEECGGKVPPRRVIKDIVKRSKELKVTSINSLYSEGDLVKICAYPTPKLSKYRCYWGILLSKNATTCIVYISVKRFEVECNLNEIEKIDSNYLTDVKLVDKQITNLMHKSDKLSSIAISILEILCQRICFSSDDLWFLEKLEERYRNHI